MAHCLKSKNYVNLMVGSKQPTASWLSVEEADAHCQAGASCWKFCSTDEGKNPDVVLVGIGVELTFEVVVAASLLRKKCPNLRIRVVNVTDLMILENAGGHPHSLNAEDFNNLFTADKPIHINYHGYANEIKGLLFGRPQLDRISVASYMEEGSTTTPFNMLIQNEVSRYHVMAQAIRRGLPKDQQEELLSLLKEQTTKIGKFILETGTDPEGTFDIPQFEGTNFGKKDGHEVGETKEDGFFVN